MGVQPRRGFPLSARGFSLARVVLARAVRQGHGIVVIFGSDVQGAHIPTRRDMAVMNRTWMLQGLSADPDASGLTADG